MSHVHSRSWSKTLGKMWANNEPRSWVNEWTRRSRSRLYISGYRLDSYNGHSNGSPEYQYHYHAVSIFEIFLIWWFFSCNEVATVPNSLYFLSLLILYVWLHHTLFWVESGGTGFGVLPPWDPLKFGNFLKLSHKNAIKLKH